MSGIRRARAGSDREMWIFDRAAADAADRFATRPGGIPATAPSAAAGPGAFDGGGACGRRPETVHTWRESGAMGSGRATVPLISNS